MINQDGESLRLYSEADEGHHDSNSDPEWQESVVLVWWDASNNIGGVHRIGHEPNTSDGPKVSLWNSIISRQGIYKATRYLPLRDQDSVENKYGSGDDTCYYDYDGDCIWKIDDGDIKASLRVEDHHVGADCYPKMGSLAEDFAPNHIEVAASVVGSVVVRGTKYHVNGLGLRDHGWGVRRWDSLLSHRWVVGTFGKEMSFVAISWHAVDDSIASFGWVVRGDTVHHAKKVDILTYTECDAASIRGGKVVYTLSGGEVIEIECTAVAKGVLSYHHNVACLDTLCEMQCGEKVGYGDFETTANIQAGTRRPVNLVNAISDDGFIENKGK